jgi:hypothetical protein
MWYPQQGGQENRICGTHRKVDRKTGDVVPTARWTGKQVMYYPQQGGRSNRRCGTYSKVDRKTGDVEPAVGVGGKEGKSGIRVDVALSLK